MNASWKILHFIAFCAALGAPIWWLTVWRVLADAASSELQAQVWRRVTRCAGYGTVGLVLTGFAEALRAASQVIEPGDLGAYWHFLVATRYGQMTLAKACLAPALYGCFVLLPPGWHRLAQLGTWGCGLGLVLSFSMAGHAAAKLGMLPLVTDAVHVLAAVVWAGGLLCMALLPWQRLREETAFAGRLLWKLFERFSVVALVAVLLLLASGAVLAFVQVYGWLALTETPYGRTLLLKLCLVVLALGLAGWQLMRLSPALKRQAQRLVPAVVHTLLGRSALLIRAEAGLILGAVGCAAVLTMLPPAERSAQVTPMTWNIQVGAWPSILTMAPLGEAGQVQFRLALSPSQGQELPSEAHVTLHLRMRDHDMGTFRRTAAPTAPGLYMMQGLISMAGTWEVGIGIQPPGDEVQRTAVTFEAATGVLEQDRERRLELAAAVASPSALLSCTFGVLCGLLALVTLWASRRGRLPAWGTPFGFCLMLCAGYLVLQAVLVDAYPATYRKNPLPVSAETLAQGQRLFQAHCVTCHGAEGHGDGPAAAGLNPRPADLTAVHVDDHTDGTLFWWLTRGMAGTAMPAWEEQLAETERWTLIHYIRSLRAARR